jgi:hypothetical protein
MTIWETVAPVYNSRVGFHRSFRSETVPDPGWLWTRRFCMIVNANILNDRECKYPSWPWIQRFCLTVDAKILHDGECQVLHDSECKDSPWPWMERYCWTVNAKILHDRECKYLIWTWMQRFYMTVNARTWMNVDERGWTWMSISKRRWPYPISAIMFSPLVLFLLKLLKCLDSNPLSISVPDEGYSRNAPRYNLSTMYCWKWH